MKYIRFDSFNFPIIDWLSKGNPFDFCLFPPQFSRLKPIYKQLFEIEFSGDKIPIEYACKSIIDIIDFDEKNINEFHKLHNEKCDIQGVLMYKDNISLLYKVSSSHKGIHDIPEYSSYPDKKIVIVCSFIGNKFLSGFVGVYCGKGEDGGG